VGRFVLNIAETVPDRKMMQIQGVGSFLELCAAMSGAPVGKIDPAKTAGWRLLVIHR
jgi:hypothetical protein